MTPENLKALHEERSRAAERIKALDTVAFDEKRTFTAEETAEEERLHAVISDADRRIARALTDLANAKAADEARAAIEGLANTAAEEGRSDDADLLRKVARGEVRAAEFVADMDEIRALAKGGANGESNTIRTLYGAVFESMRYLSTVMAANATVMHTETGEDIVIPKINGYSAATITAEATAIGASDPAFAANITLKAYKYAFLTKISRELIEDTYFDLVGFMGRQAGQAFANGPGAHFITGTGTGQPKGVLTAATVGKTLAVAGTISLDDVIDLYHSLLVPYRQRASWLFEDSAIKAVRKLKDSQGRYLWEPSTQVGAPDSLLGRPLLVDPAVPVFDATAARVFGAFGDMSGYVVRMAGAFHADASEHFAFDADQVTYRFLQRIDGNLQDVLSVKSIKNP